MRKIGWSVQRSNRVVGLELLQAGIRTGWALESTSFDRQEASEQAPVAAAPRVLDHLHPFVRHVVEQSPLITNGILAFAAQRVGPLP